MDTETTASPVDFDSAFDKAWEEGAGDERETEREFSSGTETKNAVEADESSQVQEPEKETQEIEPLAAPVFWDESTKERFYKLDRASQELVLDTVKGSQGDYTRKTQEIAEVRREVEGITEAFQPYEADIAASGMEKPELVSYLLRWNSLLNKDPDRAIAKLIELTGANPGALLQGNVAQSQGDPARSELEQRLARLEAEREEARIAEAQKSLEQGLLGLAQEKDGSGNLIRPLFQELIPAIQGTVQALAAKPENQDKSELELVDEAYRLAYAPYKKLKDEERSKLVSRSQKANLAASSISSSSGGAVRSLPKVKSTGDAVDRAFEELGA